MATERRAQGALMGSATLYKDPHYEALVLEACEDVFSAGPRGFIGDWHEDHGSPDLQVFRGLRTKAAFRYLDWSKIAAGCPSAMPQECPESLAWVSTFYTSRGLICALRARPRTTPPENPLLLPLHFRSFPLEAVLGLEHYLVSDLVPPHHVGDPPRLRGRSFSTNTVLREVFGTYPRANAAVVASTLKTYGQQDRLEDNPFGPNDEIRARQPWSPKGAEWLLSCFIVDVGRACAGLGPLYMKGGATVGDVERMKRPFTRLD